MENTTFETAKKLASKYLKMWKDMGYESGKDNYSKVGKGIFGDFFEDFIREFIKEHTNKDNVEVIKGFILSGKDASPQIDIIVCNEGSCIMQAPSKYYGVVKKQDVRLAIEVKAYLDKPTFDGAKNQIMEIKRYSDKTCLFSHRTILNYKKQYNIKAPEELKMLFSRFTDYFVILEKWERGKDEPKYDYGDGVGQLIQYLESL